MNAALALMLALVALGLMRERWERQCTITMILVIVAYLAYAYYKG